MFLASSPTSEPSLDLRPVPRLTLLDLRLRGRGWLLSPAPGSSGTGDMVDTGGGDIGTEDRRLVSQGTGAETFKD